MLRSIKDKLFTFVFMIISISCFCSFMIFTTNTYISFEDSYERLVNEN